MASEGAELAASPASALGSGMLGKAVAATEATCWDPAAARGRSDAAGRVRAAGGPGPAGRRDRIYGLLQQKPGFTPLDHELFNMLGRHAATAIFAARLYSQSARKLNTIQGFIDLLTQ